MTARRLLALLLLAVAVAVGVSTVASAGGEEQDDGGGDVAVDVVFDDARGLIPGQLVQVAGARVGTIDDVSVTADRKARIHMRIDPRFAPFRADAKCTIRPQGLIAENYVDCNPGSPDAPPLEGREGEAPTVPVEQTTQPVSLTDLFEVWNVPTSQRLGVLLTTLGIATAGRGEDIDAILRRANPTLAMARRTIRILRRENDQLDAMLRDSGTVARALAEDPKSVTALTRDAGRVAARTASQRGALAEGLRRLPGLLAEMPPALTRLDAAMAAGTPLLADLEESAPDLVALSDTVPRLARISRPVLRAYGPVLRRGARTARTTAPLTQLLANYASASLPSARTAGELFTTLEERGLTRNILEFFYTMALATARYDEQGHLLPSHVTFTRCINVADTPDPACDGTEAGPGETRGAGSSPEAERLLEFLLG